MDSALAIGVWRNDISVAREHPAPERVRADVEALAPSVAADLGAILAPYLDARDDAIILVRRLAFDCDLDLGAEARQLARYIARRCAHVLVRAIDGGSPDVVRFASQAAFRARFIADLAAGRAEQWYYRAFAGVRVLPQSTAIRTVLLDDVGVGRAALAAIADDAWPAILAALTSREAQRIVSALAPHAATMPVHARARWIAASMHCLRSAGSSACRLALRALALGLRDANVAPRLDVHTVQLAALLAAAASELAPERLSREIGRHGIGFLDRFADDATPRAALRSDRGADEASRAVIARALDELAPAAALSAAAPGESIATPYAGYALLVDEVDALLDDDFCAALPVLADDDARPVATLVALATAAGPAHAVAFVRDPAWRSVLGIAPSFDYRDFAAALTGAPAAAASGALRARVAAHARGEPIDVTWRSRDERWFAIVDMPSRLWLALERQRPTPCKAPWSTRLAAARGASRDFAGLAHHSVIDGLPDAWQAMFLLLAQVAWRRVAYRVTGLAGASLGYLRANLIGPRGVAHALARDGWRFEIARPPLYVLLNLCGLARAETRFGGEAPRSILLDYV